MPFYKVTVQYTVEAEAEIEADSVEAAEEYVWECPIHDFTPAEIVDDSLNIEDIQRI